MRYYVYSEDGQRYGPADLSTLQQWVQEGRLLPGQFLQQEASDTRIQAATLPGLVFPLAQPGGGSDYYRAPLLGSDGEQDVKDAWLYGVLGILCSGLIGAVFSVLALIRANRALAVGNRKGKGPRILAIILLTLHAVGFVALLVLLVGLSLSS